ncbi:MAG: PIN domain-containing protein [Myxococcota bacterium]
MKRAIFIDTWAFRALADGADPSHAAARDLDQRLVEAGVARVTTDYVLDEALTGLRARGGRPVAVAFLDQVDALVAARRMSVERIGEARFRAAGAVFRRLDLPRLSFTDCTSFVVMREEKIAWAFTADAHFDRVGRDIRSAFALGKDGGPAVRELPFD